MAKKEATTIAAGLAELPAEYDVEPVIVSTTDSRGRRTERILGYWAVRYAGNYIYRAGVQGTWMTRAAGMAFPTEEHAKQFTRRDAAERALGKKTEYEIEDRVITVPVAKVANTPRSVHIDVRLSAAESDALMRIFLGMKQVGTQGMFGRWGGSYERPVATVNDALRFILREVVAMDNTPVVTDGDTARQK